MHAVVQSWDPGEQSAGHVVQPLAHCVEHVVQPLAHCVEHVVQPFAHCVEHAAFAVCAVVCCPAWLTVKPASASVATNAATDTMRFMMTS